MACADDRVGLGRGTGGPVVAPAGGGRAGACGYRRAAAGSAAPRLGSRGVGGLGQRGRLAPLAGRDEGGRHAGHVVEERLAERALVERRGRMVHREDLGAARAGLRVRRPGRAVDLADPGARHEPAHRMATERDDEGRIERLDLAAQERRAGGDLVGLGVAVVGRAALDDVGDEDLVAPPADRPEQLGEERARPRRRTAGPGGPRCSRGPRRRTGPRSTGGPPPARPGSGPRGGGRPCRPGPPLAMASSAVRRSASVMPPLLAGRLGAPSRGRR